MEIVTLVHIALSLVRAGHVHQLIKEKKNTTKTNKQKPFKFFLSNVLAKLRVYVGYFHVSKTY